MDYTMVKSISIKNKFMFIKKHLFSVDPWLSLIFHKIKSYLLFISAFMSVLEDTANIPCPGGTKDRLSRISVLEWLSGSIYIFRNLVKLHVKIQKLPEKISQ